MQKINGMKEEPIGGKWTSMWYWNTV